MQQSGGKEDVGQIGDDEVREGRMKIKRSGGRRGRRKVLWLGEDRS